MADRRVVDQSKRAQSHVEGDELVVELEEEGEVGEALVRAMAE